MAVNVKKKTAHNIFFGIDIKTQETRHISEVRSGAQCGCVCALCGKPLEARKGKKRRHHFAHDTNYDCMYANEVAVYKRVAEILERDKALCVPKVYLRFDNWTEPSLLRESQTLDLKEVEFHCAPEQYPPELMITVTNSRLRILIDFGDRYYSKFDFNVFKAEAREKDFSILLLKMPRFSEENEYFYTKEHLTACLTMQGTPGEWVLSALEAKWRKRYIDKAIEPSRIKSWIECPLHKSSPGADEPFFVGCWVCGRCEFCLEDGKCIGASGIRSIDDFELPEEELQSRVKVLQKANEEKAAEEKRRYEESRRNMTERQRLIQDAMIARITPTSVPVTPILSRSKAQEMHDEAERIRQCIDPTSSVQTVDSFGRRWVMCEICGRVLQEDQITEFGGANVGLCKTCRRDGIGSLDRSD